MQADFIVYKRIGNGVYILLRLNDLAGFVCDDKQICDMLNNDHIKVEGYNYYDLAAVNKVDTKLWFLQRQLSGLDLNEYSRGTYCVKGSELIMARMYEGNITIVPTFFTSVKTLSNSRVLYIDNGVTELSSDCIGINPNLEILILPESLQYFDYDMLLNCTHLRILCLGSKVPISLALLQPSIKLVLSNKKADVLSLALRSGAKVLPRTSENIVSCIWDNEYRRGKFR